MLGLILIVVLTWQTYKAANESGRNGVLWAVGAFIGSFVLQFAIGLFVGLFYGFGQAAWGWSDVGLTALSWVISFIAMAINLLGFWLLIKYLSKIPDDSFVPPPPPPTSFS